MSLKEMIEHWKTGVEMASRNQYTAAIEAFLGMQEPGARIYFNVASMYLRLGNLPDAEEVRIFLLLHSPVISLSLCCLEFKQVCQARPSSCFGLLPERLSPPSESQVSSRHHVYHNFMYNNNLSLCLHFKT